MAWREIIIGDTTYSVSPVAERVPNSHAWRLVLNCRTGDRLSQVWAATSLQSSSRSDLYAQADRLSDSRLKAVVTEQVASGQSTATSQQP
jgi:hypothetical protein